MIHWLQKWPQFSTPPWFVPIAMWLWISSCLKVESISLLLESELAFDLLWLVECAEVKLCPVPSQASIGLVKAFMLPGWTLPLSWEWACWRMRDYAGQCWVSPVVTAKTLNPAKTAGTWLQKHDLSLAGTRRTIQSPAESRTKSLLII